jgi:hypothetical protein
VRHVARIAAAADRRLINAAAEALRQRKAYVIESVSTRPKISSPKMMR